MKEEKKELSQEEFVAKIKDIASILGYVVRNVVDDDAWLINESGVPSEGIRIFSSQYHKPDRFFINGSYPDHKDHSIVYSTGHPEITVSASRTAVAIAKDIQRRFLPVYLENLQGVNDRVKKYNAYGATRAATMKEAGVIIGIDPVFKSNNEFNSATISGKGIYITENDSETIRLEASCLTLEQLRKIAPIILSNPLNP